MFEILVVDDEKFIRKGIIAILRRDLNEEVVCLEAKNGIEALEIARRERPNLIVTDIAMPGYNGLDFIKDLKETNKSNNAQIMCMGERVIGIELSKYLVDIWLNCDFAGGSSEPKVNRIIEYEKKYLKDYNKN